MSRTNAVLVVLAVSAAVSVSTASAQQTQEPPQAQRGTGAGQRGGYRLPGPLSAQEVVRLLDAYAVVQAQEALRLNDAQYGPFVTRLKRLQETRRRNQQARNQIVGQLRQLTGDEATTVDEHAIRERLKALREQDDKAAAELRKAYDDMDQVLDARQQARFRVFEETLERRKFDLLMRARQAARRGGGS